MSGLGPQTAFQRLGDEGVVAVLRGDDPEMVLSHARRLIAHGVIAVEVTFTVPAALDVIRQLRSDNDSIVGAGTVLQSNEVESAIDAGAEFLVSPACTTAVLDAVSTAPVLVVPGCATPTEIAIATLAGALAVKVFPVSRLGGPAYLKDLAGPFPGLAVMPSGGIPVSDVDAYRDAGAWCIALGGTLAHVEDRVLTSLAGRGGVAPVPRGQRQNPS